MKRLTFILTLFICFGLSASAVLKEHDLPKTLRILRLELERNYNKQKVMLLQYEQQSADQHAALMDYVKQSEQISLILYSQKSDFTFDIAYACQEATNLYRKLNKNTMPYDKIKENLLSEIARYDSLIISLKALPPAIKDSKKSKLTAVDSITMNIITDSAALAKAQIQVQSETLKPIADMMKSQSAEDDEKENEEDKKDGGLFILSEEDQADRKACLDYAIVIRDNMKKFLDSLEEDSYYYSVVTQKVEKMNSYAQERYKDLQAHIFTNNGRNYFKILATLPLQIAQVKNDYYDKYQPLSEDKEDKSEWRGPIVLGVSVFMIFYILFAAILSNLILRWIPALTKKIAPKFAHKFGNRFHRIMSANDYKKKSHTLTWAFGVLLFAIAIMIVKGFIHKNIFIMAADLMISFAWLIEAILVSLLIRLTSEQIQHGVKIYMPFLWMALTVIFFRIILIPNNMINLICPPILLFFTIWQTIAIRKNRTLPLVDIICSGISLAAMVVSCICAWFGMTLLAVQIIIWWTFQLACIETINCVYDLVKSYENGPLFDRIFRTKETTSEKKMLLRDKKRKVFEQHVQEGQYINKTWLYDFVLKVLIPVAAVFSIPCSVYLAAGIFEMQAAFIEIIRTKVSVPSVGTISMFRICIVAGSFFIFKYLNYLINSTYKMIRISHEHEIGRSLNETLSKNIIGIIVWGIFVLFVLNYLDVPSEGIKVAAAGLATGMGFAMKDLLENFFYGISLMTGRLRVGDYIECDGIRGQVESITYQSTQIITDDGSVMAFLNSALFSKNFKNLTRNHNYEFTSITVGVAYGTDIQRVREIIVSAIDGLREQTPDGRYIIDKHRDVEVRVSNFGDSSVDLNVITWALVDKKYGFLAKAKEVIYDSLNKNGIEIPYPQRDIFIKNFEKKS